MKLYELFVELSLNDNGFNQKMNKATAQGESFAHKMTSSVSAGTIALGNLMARATETGLRAVGELAKAGVSYNSQMEDYTTNFRVMLGSTEAAALKVEELKTMAAKTPFGMEDLASATQTLLSFGIEADKTTDILSMLGDISLGDKEKLSSLTLAFAQVSSAGKLTGQDLLQMINAGFNPLQSISEKTGASIGDLKEKMAGGKGSKEFQKMIKAAQKEVKKMGDGASESAKLLAQIGEDGAISAEMVAYAFESATSEGGRFYNGMEEASKTFSGQLSTLKDDLGALVGDVFQPAFDWLSDNVLPYAIEATSKLSEGFKTGGLSGMLAAAGEIISDLGSKLKTKAEELLPDAINGVVDTINGLFELNLPKIESIKLPTFAELKQGFSDWWNGLGGEGGILPQLQSLLTWGLGAMDSMPTLPEIITKVSAWWNETVYPQIANFFGWSLEANPGLPSVAEVVGTITSWWDTLVIPLLEGVFSWALGEEIDLPTIEDIKNQLSDWWNNELIPVLNFFSVKLFGVELPSAETIAKEIREWWNSVKEAIGSLFVTAEVNVGRPGVNTNPTTGETFWDPIGIGNVSLDTIKRMQKDFSLPGAATGLDYIPYDDYAVRLHEGEAVLTKLEAENWRNGRSAAGAGEIVTVNVNLDNVSIRDERDIETLAQQIAQYTRRQNYGMGAVAY